MIPFNIADNNLVFIANGRPYNVARDHTNFAAIREALLSSTLTTDELINLADIPKAIHTTSNGRIEVINGQVFYKGNPLHNIWTERLHDFYMQNVPFDPILKAIESLMRNPSFMARERFPLFQQNNQLGFLPDGRLTGLKAISSNWKDKYSGTLDNRPGQVLTMPREEISDSPLDHCSHGLHIGSWDYVSSYGSNRSDRIILCAFAAEDVVAVPNDLQTKIRVCRYEVLQELDRSAVDAFIEANRTVVNNPLADDEDEVDLSDLFSDDCDDCDY